MTESCNCERQPSAVCVCNVERSGNVGKCGDRIQFVVVKCGQTHFE